MKALTVLLYVFLTLPLCFGGGNMPLGFFPKKVVALNPVLSWGGSGGGIYPGGHEVATLTNTGTASSGTITFSLNVVSGSFSIYYLGMGDTCSGAVLAPGGSCVVDVQDDAVGAGSVNLHATDGTVTATPDANYFDCPGC